MSKSAILLTLLLAAACSAKQTSQSGTGFNAGIINGELSDPNSSTPTKSVVMLMLMNDAGGGQVQVESCTGTLISERIVLTAGHCVQGAIGKTLHAFPTIAPGKSMTEEQAKAVKFPIMVVGGFQGSVQAVAAPSSFVNEDGVIQNDIGLLLLSAPYGLSAKSIHPKIDTIGLGTAGRQVISLGYGVNEIDHGFLGMGEATKSTDKKLRQKPFVVVNYEDLGFNVTNHDSDSIFTIATPDEASGQTCQGDSGGPSFVKSGANWYVVGVTSSGDQECEKFSALTNVKLFNNWIKAKAAAWGVALY